MTDVEAEFTLQKYGFDVIKKSEDACTAEGGSWITIRGVHVCIKEGESAADAFKRTTGKKLDGNDSPIDGKTEKDLNTHTTDNKTGKDKMYEQTFSQRGQTFSAEIGQPETVNEFGDKMPSVKNLTFNNETYNVGDIINVVPEPDSFWESEKQYKIVRINQTLPDSQPKYDKQIVIVGVTAGGSDIVIYPDNFKHITKQKFSR